ncbi:MAG: hypothetical protein ABIS06_07090 [Vicinamibacterales bacterium]
MKSRGRADGTNLRELLRRHRVDDDLAGRFDLLDLASARGLQPVIIDPVMQARARRDLEHFNASVQQQRQYLALLTT